MAWFSFNRRLLKQIDWWLVGAVFALTAFGIVVIDGTTHGVPYRQFYAKRQMIWWALSTAVFVFILLIDYSQLAKLAVPAYAVCVALLAGLLVRKGAAIKGAASWYDLGIVGFQPSEFTKLAVVLVASAYLARIKVRLPGWGDMAVVALLVLVPFVLVALEPDMGTAVVFLPLAVVMPWAAGARRRIFVVLAALLLLAVVVYGTATVLRHGDFPFLKPYQENRLKAFFSDLVRFKWGEATEAHFADSLQRRERWAPLQARIALGSGGIFGKGWRRGTQTQLEFLPEAHTDYIFASCGEQFGLLGCSFVLILYALIVYRSLVLALRSKDWFGYLIVVGFMTIFITHAFLNIGVATDLLPVTGLPLPFLSSGGSFLLTMYVGFAMVVNVGMRKYMF